MGSSAGTPARARDVAPLVALSHRLAAAEHRPEIADIVASRLLALLSAEGGGLLITVGDTLLLRRAHGSSSVAVSFDAAIEALPQQADVLQALQGCSPVFLQGPSPADLHQALFGTPAPTESPACLTLLPLVVSSEAVGLLYVKTAQPLDEQDLGRALAIADAAALALGKGSALRALHEEHRALSSARALDEERMAELSRYLDFFESSRDAMLVMDLRGKVLFANPVATHIIGLDQDALLGAHFSDLFAEETQAAINDVIDGFSYGRYPLGLDFNLRKTSPPSRSSSTTRPSAPGLSRANHERIANVNFSGVMRETSTVLATVRDVTSERELARELARMRDFLERVIESSVDGIVSADLRGTILVYNSAAARLFGHPRHQVIGKMSVEELYPSGVAKDVMRRIRAREHGGRGLLRDFRVDLLTRNREHVPVSLSANLVVDGRKAVGTFGIFTDVREKLAMEARLSRAQKDLQNHEKQSALAELAGAAAHELNQPLTAVMGYAEFLKRVIDDESPHHKAIDVILGETERMADIVRKVGKITKYETKSYVGQAKIVDLDASSSASSWSSAERQREAVQGPSASARADSESADDADK